MRGACDRRALELPGRPCGIYCRSFSEPTENPRMPHLRMTHVSTALLLCGAMPTAFASRVHGQPARAAATGAPAFKVDPSWPMEMPDKWILGSVTGVFVD